MKTFIVSTYNGDFNRLPREVLNNIQEHGELLYPDYQMTVIRGYNGDKLRRDRCDYVAFCVHPRDVPHFTSYQMDLLPLVLVFKINKDAAPELVINSIDNNWSTVKEKTLSEVMNCNKYIKMHAPQNAISYNIHVLDDAVYLDAVGIEEEFRVNYIHDCIHRFSYNLTQEVVFDIHNINNVLSAYHIIVPILEKTNTNH